jgi:hypothetical protein
MAHQRTGTPLPWQEALQMPGAEQMHHLAGLMASLPWWTLRPAPDLIAHQPGRDDAGRMVVASRAEDGRLALVYSPSEEALTLRLAGLATPARAVWFDPRTAARHEAGGPDGGGEWTVRTPGPGDWVLLLRSDRAGGAR